MQITMVIVRFAPSPTGIPHIGNIRTALFNYFFAKANNGKFLLRIEDTDQARIVEGAEDAIKESLLWLGIAWDGDIIHQSNLVANYKKYAEELVEKGLAKKEDGAIRFITAKTGKTSWTDKVGDKKIEFENSEIEDFIILKSDGFPTYHLANVIDDNKEGVTHVIRGEDWISSTPKHIMLYEAFGWKAPAFAHVPNILGTDRKKLSKRRGAKSVLDFKNEGFLPEALVNYLMLLGWSPKDDREILEKEEIGKIFTLENINVAPAIFDQKKLDWINGEYIRKLSNEELLEKLKEFFNEDKIMTAYLHANKTIMDGVIDLARTRLKKLSDFKNLVLPLESPLNQEEKEVSRKVKSRLLELSDFNSESILKVFKEITESNRIRMQEIYRIFTRRDSGLPLPQYLELLGKEKTLELLK